jgi:hypothetical protein
MSTVKGAVNTNSLLTGGASPQSGVGSWLTAGYIRGDVHIMIDYYAAAGTEASGTLIQMFPVLDTGIMVIGFILGVVGSTGALTGSIGDLNSATRYANANTNFATAGTYIMGAGTTGLTSTGPYVIGTNVTSATNTDQQIIITTGGATLGATNVFSLMLLYVID